MTCYECHLSSDAWAWPVFKADEITRMYPRELFGDGLSGSVARTGRAACLGCHARVLATPVGASGLRIDHATCATTDSCDDCHSTAAHGTAVRWTRQVVMEECIACHAGIDAPRTCETCHEARSETERLAKGPWQITHGPSWEKTHGMGDLRSCDTCHPKDYCVRCHEIPLPHPVDFPALHGKQAQRAPASCAACHDAEELCDPCHGLEMPHPAGFRATHSETAGSRADEGCLTCHYETDCRACHEAHTHPGSTDGSLGQTLPSAGDGS
ncbi:MAG: hypothetical protein ACYC52_06095 [Coriobacteriia bacterium]